MRCRFDYILEHRNDGITVIFANPSKKVVRQLEEAKLVAHIGALCRILLSLFQVTCSPLHGTLAHVRLRGLEQGKIAQ